MITKANDTLVLPYPPSVNNYWKKWNNRIVLGKEGREYKAKCQELYGHLKPSSCQIGLVVRVWRPRRAGDLDNTLKAILDALKGIVYNDDKQVVEIHAFRADDKTDPRAEVTYFECE